MVAPYVVAPGDTLYSISQKYYGNGYDWPEVYDANRTVINDPNLIYPGERLVVSPRHAADVVQISPAHVPSVRKDYVPRHSTGYVPQHGSNPPIDGAYSCAALESLWIGVGGNPASAHIAAQIATAESGGNPSAISPTDDYGLWQINGSHGSLATLDPVGNARAAVEISDNGTDWAPWTTYTSGIYAGEC
jgi:LysM repeat protein